MMSSNIDELMKLGLFSKYTYSAHLKGVGNVEGLGWIKLIGFNLYFSNKFGVQTWFLASADCESSDTFIEKKHYGYLDDFFNNEFNELPADIQNEFLFNIHLFT